MISKGDIAEIERQIELKKQELQNLVNEAARLKYWWKLKKNLPKIFGVVFIILLIKEILQQTGNL